MMHRVWLAVALLLTQPQPSTIPEMWDAWCARCHAADGSGKVNEPTITVEPMDFTDCTVASPEPDADWELAISHGGPAVGLSPEMPAFGDTLTSEQVRGFVDHIRGYCKERGWPHGNLNLPRPIFTEKAFPENEIVLLPRIRRDEFDLIGIYERRFGKRGMWEIGVPVTSRSSGDTHYSGLADVEIAAKYVLMASHARSQILSAGIEVVLPTGSYPRASGHRTTMFEPYLAAGAVAGSVYLQAQTKWEFPAGGGDSSERAFVYNVYAGRDTSGSPNTWTLGIELNGENKELALTPQVRKGLTMTGALGMALGVQIPLNERRERSTSIVGYLLWEYLEPVRARQ